MCKRLLILLSLSLVTTCHHSQSDRPATVRQSSAQPAASESSRQPPTEAEVHAVLKRNYEDVVTVDDTRPTPFMIGDFNGDNSEDIAIVVKPRKLSDLNSGYVNWILEDPHHLQKASLNVRLNEVLLAVIHGHKREGWRHELARQTYLLKNAVGTDLETLSNKQLRDSDESRLLPPLRGDVIREKLKGSGGIIY